MGAIGSKTSEITRTTIETRIETNIENMNKNVTDLITKQITNTSTSIINKNAVSIDQKTGANIDGKIKGIKIGGTGIKFGTDQQATVESQNKAVVNLINDTNEMQKLTSKIIDDLKSKMKNDSVLSDAVNSAAKVNAAKNNKDEGGIAGMVDKVTDIIKNMGVNNTVTKDTETNIKNSLMMKLSNVNINETAINNTIESNISSTMQSINETGCSAATSADLTLSVEDIEIEGENIDFVLKQGASVKAFNECITGSTNINEITKELDNSTTVTATNDQGNWTSKETKITASAVADVSETKYVGAALEKMIGNIFTSPATSFALVVVAIAYMCYCCLAGMFILPMLLPRSSGSSGSSE